MAIATNITLNDKEKTLVEALWNIYELQNLNVRLAFREKIESEILEETEFQKDVKESFTRAYSELREGDVKHDARNLFENQQ